MPADSPLSHEELLTLTRKVVAAARDRDQLRLQQSAERLSRALAAHLEAEHPALEKVSPPEGAALASGQQRLVHLLVELLRELERGDSGNWEPIADELLAVLTVQAGDERRAFAPLPVNEE